MALPRSAIVGNSMVRMYLPGPRNSRSFGAAWVAPAIFTPGAKVLPPLVERKIHSDRCSGAPLQCGSVTASFSATTYRVPVVGLTIGVAPMNWLNEHPLVGCRNLAA